MVKPRVLIVEDNFLLGADLAEVVQEDLNAEVVLVTGVSDALRIAPRGISLALLDIEVVEGKSYPVARKLIENNIPVIFVTGNERSSLPADLQDVPLLAKPVQKERLVRLAKALTSAFA